MGGLISVVLSDIYICKIEEDTVAPSKPLFYKRKVNAYTYIKYIGQKKKKRMKLMNFTTHLNHTTKI